VENQRWARWKGWGVLGLVFVIGALIVWASHHWFSETSKEITQEIGVAFMVAAILGLTIDQASKNELIRNGFLAAFQYAFPAPLQKEILRIATYRLICERHHWLVRIEKIDDECVGVSCETNRKVRNIGSSAVKLGPRIHIDEWGFVQEASKILECKMEVERGPTILATAKATKDDQPTILFEGREVSIKPNG
jgi:hypothetical protein